MTAISNWMHVDVFTVDQASALWCGFDPAQFGILTTKFPSEMEAVKQVIIGGIVTGQIISDSTRNVMHSIGDYSKTYVTRSELEKFARRKKMFPAFLFNTFAPFENTDSSLAKQNRLTATIATVPQAQPPSNQGGRPPEYDWDSFMLEIIRRANVPDGLPDSQAELVREMLQWFSVTFGSEPAESSVKTRTSKIYNYLADAKAKAKNPDV
jgi:hypothetical protein